MKMVFSGLFAFGLFLGVILSLHFGWRIGRRRLARLGEGGLSGVGAIEGSIYGLVGLLIAFTFTGAASRFDQRRQLITQQVNAISTAWLRLDLVSARAQPALRELFRSYVDAQLRIGQAAGDPAGRAQAVARLGQLQGQIWTQAVAVVAQQPQQPLAMALLPPLNDMFDIATTRILMTRQHPPVAIYGMLGMLVLASALMAGFGMAKADRQSPLHVVGFALIMGLSVYLILELEFPRIGFVRVDSFDRALIELRASMD